DESLKLELDAIADLGKTESTQNLIRNFFLAEKYKKGSKQFEKVAHAAIIGAGVMGAGIAQWLSSRGVTVILRDVNRELLDRGLASIEKTYGDAVKRGLMTEEKAKQGRARIVASTAPMELRDVQFVIEAASEKIDIKKEIFREWRGRAEDRHRPGGMGDADGTVALDRRDRNRRHRRYRDDPRESIRPSRSRAGNSAAHARVEAAWSQERRRFLQIRRPRAI